MPIAPMFDSKFCKLQVAMLRCYRQEMDLMPRFPEVVPSQQLTHLHTPSSRNRTSEHFTPLHYFLKLGSHIPSEKQFASTEMSASSCLAQGKLAFRELSIAQVQNLCHEVISSMPCGRAHNVIQIHVHCRACYGHAVQVQELTDDAPLLMRGSTLDHLPRVVQ
jgi:hypothetical protein